MALATGGGSGIGRSAALTFGHSGARVVMADLDLVGGAATQRRLEAAGAEARFAQTDVTRAVEVERLVDEVLVAFGRLDCAFNNAGIDGQSPTIAGTEEADAASYVSGQAIAVDGGRLAWRVGSNRPKMPQRWLARSGAAAGCRTCVKTRCDRVGL